MALIRPCADLRNNYNEISRICHETKEPVYITRNGANDLVILSDEAFKSITNANRESEDEKIERLISKHFDKHYATFEDFKKELCQKLDDALNEIKEGKGIPMDIAVAEMEEKYDLH